MNPALHTPSARPGPYKMTPVVEYSPSARPPPYLAADVALYLDFDGTLAELALRPEAVKVSASLPALLTRMYARHGGAVAIITGRRLMHVDMLLAPVRLPGAGVHGAELRLHTGEAPRVSEVASIAPLIKALREMFDDDERILIEDKGAAAALHFRLAPERGVECVDTMRRLAASYGLDVVPGNMVVEAHAHGINKGEALRTLSRNAPFAGRTPVFIGDDRSDEFAFDVAQELGGYGVKVGAGATSAQYRLPTVSDVHSWLRSTF